jgi:DNA-binding transcriptional regulator YhcF (GntR family)
MNSSVSPFITSDEVSNATGVDPSIVRKAFEKLEKEGYGRVEVVNGRAAFIFKKITG